MKSPACQYLLSCLLFEKSFCRELIKLGYSDTLARREGLMTFLDWPADNV